MLQGKDDNYDIDLFNPFWQKLTELSGITYAGKYPEDQRRRPGRRSGGRRSCGTTSRSA